MKNKYFLYLFVSILLVCGCGLYFIDIPVPSTIISEAYTLNLK